MIKRQEEDNDFILNSAFKNTGYDNCNTRMMRYIFS